MSGPERNSFSCNVTPRISFPKPSPARVIPRTLVLCERHLHTVTPATWVLLTAHSALYGNLFCDVMFMLCYLFARGRNCSPTAAAHHLGDFACVCT